MTRMWVTNSLAAVRVQRGVLHARPPSPAILVHRVHAGSCARVCSTPRLRGLSRLGWHRPGVDGKPSDYVCEGTRKALFSDSARNAHTTISLGRAVGEDDGGDGLTLTVVLCLLEYCTSLSLLSRIRRLSINPGSILGVHYIYLVCHGVLV